MKKRIFAVLMTAMMTVSMAVTAFAADTTSDLIAKFKFDESLANEVTGTDATIVANQFSQAAPAVTLNYTDGVDGKAVMLGTDNASGAGLNLGVKPATGKNFTVSLWVNATTGSANDWTPLLFMGKSNQAPECWVGLKGGGPGFKAGKTPYVSSNDSTGARVGVSAVAFYDTTKAESYDGSWVNITYTVESKNVEVTTTDADGNEKTETVENIIASMYLDGVLVGMTDETKTLPDVIADGDDTVSTYIAANAWADPAYQSLLVDNVYIYDRTLTSDDVKALVEETNVNKVELIEFIPMPTTIDYVKPPQKADTSLWVTEEEEPFPTPIIIAAAVVVVLVVIIVLVLVISKSKKKGSNDDKEV